MKKLVLLLAVVFSVSLVSCGNKSAQGAATDSDSVAPVDTTVVDSAATVADSVAAPVATDSVAK